MDKIKAKIIELCPDVMEAKHCCDDHTYCDGFSDITLAVVLRAIPLAYLTRGDNGQAFIKIRDVAYRPNDGGCEWNLLKNYDNQTKETQQCIGQLLGINE